MARSVEHFTVLKQAHPKIVGYPVRRSGAMYGLGLGFYSTVQQPTDMAVKAGIGAGIGWLLGIPHGALLGGLLGLASTIYSNHKLQQANAAGVAGYGCGCC